MKPRRRRDKGRPRGQAVVDAVLEQALHELATSGIHAFSVERVAINAAVNKTSVYRRWPTREALVVAALERTLVGVTSQVPDTGTLRGDLLGLLAPVVGLLSSPVGVGVLRASVAESASSAVRELATGELRRTTNPIAAIVARARRRGEWRAGVSGRQLVFMLVGAMMHRVLLEHAKLSKTWVLGLVDLALYGASPPRR